MPLPLRRPVNRASRGDQVAPRPVTGEDLAGGGGLASTAAFLIGAGVVRASGRTVMDRALARTWQLSGKQETLTDPSSSWLMA